MSSIVNVLIAVMIIFVTFITPLNGFGIGDCFETWSRCSRWSSWGTGYLWADCNTRCQQLGKRGGQCVLSPSTCWMSNQAYQCQCY